MTVATMQQYGNYVVAVRLAEAAPVVSGGLTTARARAETGATHMRENGVRSLAVSCLVCHHEATMSVEAWPDDVAVTAFRRRMVCTGCGMIGADVRPNWKEQSPRPSLTGAHWQR